VQLQGGRDKRTVSTAADGKTTLHRRPLESLPESADSMGEAVQHLVAPRPPHHRRRLDPVGLVVAVVALAVVVGVAISVGSLIDRYVGWATVGIAVGVVSLAFLVGMLRLALTDRLAEHDSR
jgi:hypothetical protein